MSSGTRNSLAKTIGIRLILGLFFISSLMVLLISVVVRTQMNRSGAMLTEATQSHLISAAQALAKFISAEELDLYHTIEDTETGAYQELKHRLVTFAENNNLLYAYYWRYYGDNQLQFIVDNDFDPEEIVGPWVIMDLDEDYLAGDAIAGNIVVSNLMAIVPTWDGLITAYAPVYDSEGNLYCIAGVDIRDRYLFIQRRDAQRMTLLQLFAIPFSVISGILNMILYRRRAKQIQQANLKLAHEKDVIQTMKDNIHQGIFLMDKELNILPQYSRQLRSILSYYDSELAGKNFLDILSVSLDVKQLQTMKGFFSMVFSKFKSEKVLGSANPISEFEYKVDGQIKILSTKFHLIEQKDTDPMIVGIIQDITREKDFEKELVTQREAQELEMKNMFDVIQLDPLVFQDFIEDIESNFHFINSILKDRSLTVKQVLTKFFQNVHAMKSNALILGLEMLGKKLHILEDEIKLLSGSENVSAEDILGLTEKLEIIMQDKDEYSKIVRKIEAFKVSNQMDTVLLHSLTKAVEKIAGETNKKVEFKAGQIDMNILETRLRKPIKDILFQCIRNSIYHGIEPVNERVGKNKKPVSLLVFSIKNIDNNAVITFSDDGRGLDWEKIKAKYLALHPDARNVNKKLLLATIFSPEFSTSEGVTTVAGRGIGLSLVKDLIKEYNGKINVDSSDAGLTLRFTFPLAS
jgi:two-component system chemotaxis sensor kinase CheA